MFVVGVLDAEQLLVVFEAGVPQGCKDFQHVLSCEHIPTKAHLRCYTRHPLDLEPVLLKNPVYNTQYVSGVDA